MNAEQNHAHYDFVPMLPVSVGKPLEEQGAGGKLSEEEKKALHNTLALMDTGSGIGGMDFTLIQKLNLPKVDEMEIAGVGGVQKHSIYAASLFVRTLNLYHPARFADMALAPSFEILLGRDFMRYLCMTYDGIHQETTFSTAPMFKQYSPFPSAPLKKASSLN